MVVVRDKDSSPLRKLGIERALWQPVRRRDSCTSTALQTYSGALNAVRLSNYWPAEGTPAPSRPFLRDSNGKGEEQPERGAHLPERAV
jgi:hypothetical protein